MKKDRPENQAELSDICLADITPAADLTQAPRRTPKKHRARDFMLNSGVNGFTENEILRYCRLSSGRNYFSELERQLDIQLERIDEKNPDGIGSHLRYRFTCRADVLRVIQLVNRNASAGGYIGLSSQQIDNILSLYPDAFSDA